MHMALVNNIKMFGLYGIANFSLDLSSHLQLLTPALIVQPNLETSLNDFEDGYYYLYAGCKNLFFGAM
tara:strand:- start:864 stop:1067 length:204 start_codon:yes stop_codon:yes gene_type:complete